MVRLLVAVSLILIGGMIVVFVWQLSSVRRERARLESDQAQRSQTSREILGGAAKAQSEISFILSDNGSAAIARAVGRLTGTGKRLSSAPGDDATVLPPISIFIDGPGVLRQPSLLLSN